MTLRERLRDWLRGYGEDDVRSARAKLLNENRIGSVITVTRREYNALSDARTTAAFTVIGIG